MNDDLVQSNIRATKKTVRRMKELKDLHFDSQGNKISLNSFLIELMKRYERVMNQNNEQSKP